ncbi:hypothetical protein H2200_012699 [Cladophialophora chaetospira]|uniref:Uncharacterized protein n=1 Tax=Cladophialophora chaetospira TaxID=386627 RepID=A0AA38WXG2_9EURO|nr:hypothetical protein H2200_012699 [Cladophialophora chaetospira]
MPNGTFFQAAPSSSPTPSSMSNPPLSSHPHTTHQSHHTSHLNTNTTPSESGQEAATKLAEAIDDFLGDLEKKFKGISDEILTKLDDMAERCDRLEQEMLVRETSGSALEGKESQAGSG